MRLGYDFGNFYTPLSFTARGFYVLPESTCIVQRVTEWGWWCHHGWILCRGLTISPIVNLRQPLSLWQFIGNIRFLCHLRPIGSSSILALCWPCSLIYPQCHHRPVGRAWRRGCYFCSCKRPFSGATGQNSLTSIPLIQVRAAGAGTGVGLGRVTEIHVTKGHVTVHRAGVWHNISFGGEKLDSVLVRPLNNSEKLFWNVKGR